MKNLAKTRVSLLATAFLAVGLLVYSSSTFSHAQEQDGVASPEDITKEYLSNMRDRWSANEPFLLGSATFVVGISADKPGTSWVKTGREVIKEGGMPGGNANVTIDKISSTKNATLASVHVDYHSDGANSRAVFTFAFEHNKWKIAAIVFESRPK